MSLDPLPIDPILPRVVGAIRADGAAVLVAEPGAGKTTRVPRALLEARFADAGEIWVLEPRRLAARLAAERVAWELGEPLGGRVGYQVRLEKVVGVGTQIRFVTEGILTRRLVEDPLLPGIGTVVLDELHERHLEGDMALALLDRLRAGPRKELNLLAMSATLDADKVAQFLRCKTIRAKGRPHPVTIELASQEAKAPLHRRVANGTAKALKRADGGDVLVFLPGAAQIRKAHQACSELFDPSGVSLRVLHGSLSPREQNHALEPSTRRKIILSTNVAETSITVPGVSAVVDSGLARRPAYSPWSGLSRMAVAPISQASATQRAGRAGRLGPGYCLRLYTQGDFEMRRPFEEPEIRSADLTGWAVRLKLLGIDATELRYVDTPKEAALLAAEKLLDMLGATEEGKLTDLGEAMARLPLHPRLARVFLEAKGLGCARRGALLAALLSEPSAFASAASLLDGQGGPDEEGDSDLLPRLERLEAALREGLGGRTAARYGLRLTQAKRVARFAAALDRAGQGGADQTKDTNDTDTALGISLLAGFPDRVARRLKPRGSSLALAHGGAIELSDRSAVRGPRYLLGVEAEELRHGKGRITLAHAMEPEWLIDLFPDEIREKHATVFEEKTERVVSTSALMYGNLAIDESTDSRARGEEVSRLLAKAATAAGWKTLWDMTAVDVYLRRIAFAAPFAPGLSIAIQESFLEATVAALCEGKSSFAELRKESLRAAIDRRLDPAAAAALRTLAPETVAIPGRKRVPITYERDRPPFIASRLQDFFGTCQVPTLAEGKVSLVLHLLAPNGRAVQVTTDLQGFWERHYPQVRKELMRRYPKHAWPEDPKTAAPSRPGRRRK